MNDVQAGDGSVNMDKPMWLVALQNAHARGSLANHAPRQTVDTEAFKESIKAGLAARMKEGPATAD
jgi:hypothetical protein